VISTVPITAEVVRAFAFKITAGQIIEDHANALGKSVLVELLFQRHPAAIEQIHRFIEVVFIKRLLGGQAAGLG